MTCEITLLTAFALGFLGSVHCVGMCGGIVGALTLGLPDEIRQSPLRMAPYLIAYNAGRLISYAAAGGLMGWAGAQLLYGVFIAHAQSVGIILSGLFMIALGLYLAGWWQALTVLEKAGGVLWRQLEPVGRRLIPVRNPAHAIALGALWGWLPCGMVYAALVWAVTAGSATQGALLMLAFGAGTLPMLLAMGVSAQWLRRLVRKPRLRQAVGLMVVLFGLYALLAPGGHRHSGQHQHQEEAPVTTRS